MSISLLPPHLINQIAAGEVLTRPASAVKELLENSLDANSSFIELTVGRGGLDMIRVTDNGHGIAADDFPMAIAPHATSKLSAFHDLLSLKTFGFRGEALACLAGVSDFRLISKIPEAPYAYLLAHRDAQAVGPTITAHPNGTTVEARDLFYNVPARRKFLRPPRSEWYSILSVCQTMALNHPEVEFLIKHDGRTILHCPPILEDKDPIFKRLLQIFKVTADQTFYISNDSTQSLDEIKIFGWILPKLTPQKRVFFVNQRPVKNLMLQQALRAALVELKQDAAHANLFEDLSYLFFITLPSSQVDINVHPAKEEVRFRDPLQVHHTIFSTVRCELIRAQSMIDKGEAISPSSQKPLQPLTSGSCQRFDEPTPASRTLPGPEDFSRFGFGSIPSEDHSKKQFVLFCPSDPKKADGAVSEPSRDFAAVRAPMLPLQLGDFLGNYENQFLIFRLHEMLYAYPLKPLYHLILLKDLQDPIERAALPSSLILPGNLPNLTENLAILGFRFQTYADHLLLLEVPKVLCKLNWEVIWSKFLTAAFDPKSMAFQGWQHTLIPLIDDLLPLEINAQKMWLNSLDEHRFSEEELWEIYRQRLSFSLKAWLKSS